MGDISPQRRIIFFSWRSLSIANEVAGNPLVMLCEIAMPAGTGPLLLRNTRYLYYLATGRAHVEYQLPRQVIGSELSDRGRSIGTIYEEGTKTGEKHISRT
jgi:hypothetical protein